MLCRKVDKLCVDNWGGDGHPSDSGGGGGGMNKRRRGGKGKGTMESFSAFKSARRLGRRDARKKSISNIPKNGKPQYIFLNF